jgi:hypothetical protein
MRQQPYSKSQEEMEAEAEMVTVEGTGRTAPGTRMSSTSERLRTDS